MVKNDSQVILLWHGKIPESGGCEEDILDITISVSVGINANNGENRNICHCLI